MKISVLTVCRNAADTIRYTLDSFFEQDHHDKEIVIVDGASTDNTLGVIGSYPQENIILLCEADRGMYDALNKALRLYSGDAVGVLNADDAYHDQTILTRVAEAFRETDIVHGHLDFVASHDTRSVVRRWRAGTRPARGFRTGWMPAHPTFYVRRAVAEKVGDFDLSLPIAADYDWMLRAVELFGFRSGLIDHVMIDMLQGGRSTAGVSAYLRHNLEALRVRQRWLGAGKMDYAMVAKPARKIVQFIAGPSTPHAGDSA